MKYQLHLSHKQKLISLLYLICVLFAGFLIGFSLRFDRYAVVGNSTGTDWKGYISGSLEINILTEPKNRSSHGTASLHKSVDNLYTANNLVIPDVIRKNNKFYDLVQIDENAFYIDTDHFNSLLTGSLTIGNNVHTIEQYAFALCSDLNGKLILGNNVVQIEYCAFWSGNFNNENFTIWKNINVGEGAFIGNKFERLTFCEDIVVEDNAFAMTGSLNEIICDGWTLLPTNWGSGIFTAAKNNGYVSSINSNLSSTTICGFLKSHGLAQNWQPA